MAASPSAPARPVRPTPEAIVSVVSVNGYLIQDIRTAMTPIQPDREAGLRYFFYFLTEPGPGPVSRARGKSPR
jgi:hypothetical protein